MQLLNLSRLRITNAFVLIILSVSTYSQISSTTSPPPPIPPFRATLEVLTKEEQQMFLNAKQTIQENDLLLDSLRSDLIRYLINLKDITNYQAVETAKLIYQIPGKESLYFLLKNIDVFITGAGDGGLHQQGKAFPFYTTLLSSNTSDELGAFLDIIIHSNLLDLCEINGKKLSLLYGILNKESKFRKEIVEGYLNLALKEELSPCKRQNLEALLLQKYPNQNYSTKIKP